MSIEKRVKEIIEKKEKNMKNDKQYQEFMGRYLRMLEQGLVKKQQYEIPPIDTIGKRLCQTEEAEE